MSLEVTAQELFVIDPETNEAHDVIPIPLEVMEQPAEHEHEGLHVSEEGPVEVVIELGDLPGAPHGTPDPRDEPVLEVTDEEKPQEPDANDAKSKKNEKWDWESKGAHGFVAWIKERIDDVPKHSGYDSAGLERAISYMEKLDNEISRAMRLDLDGQLDANKIEEVRSKIDDSLSRLNARLDKVKKHSKNRRKKKADETVSSFIKEGQKIMGVEGVYIVAPIFISRLARVCINGMVSAGHDIEDMYDRQVKRWKLSEREQAELLQLLSDMGYSLRQDRGYMPGDDVDTASSSNFDWAANYRG